ncbi:MAG: hypothetical protein WBQ75_04875 [Acetobacteraceae bacterium]
MRFIAAWFSARNGASPEDMADGAADAVPIAAKVVATTSAN